MSAKLVKKLLMATSHHNDAIDHSAERGSRKRKDKASAAATSLSKEEIVQSHLRSILRLDSKIQHRTSSTASKSLERIKHRQKREAKSKNAAKHAEVGNSRSSASAFAKRKQEPTLDKRKSGEEREEDYFRGVARALKKAKKGKK